MADTSIAELLLPLTLFLTADSCTVGNSTAVSTTGTLAVSITQRHMNNSQEFLKLIGDIFHLRNEIFTFDIYSRKPDYNFPNLKKWETKSETSIFDSIYYELNNTVLSLNLKVKKNQKQHFNYSWNNLIEKTEKEFPDYEISIDNQFYCIKDSQIYLLVRKETEENTILSITL